MEAITWNYRVQISNIEGNRHPFHKDGTGTEGWSGARTVSPNRYIADGRCTVISRCQPSPLIESLGISKTLELQTDYEREGTRIARKDHVISRVSTSSWEV